MSLTSCISRIIELLYIPPVARLVPYRIFRYGACGALNMVLDTLWYFVAYNFIVCKQVVNLGFVAISPHIFSLLVVFPITFVTGFLLNRYVAFRSFRLNAWRQIVRYGLSVAGSLLLNYVAMKLLVETFGLWPTPAKVATTMICTIYSYLVGRYYTFSE